MGDPSDPQVLVMPLSEGLSVDPDQAYKALDMVGLLQRVVKDRTQWQSLDAVIVVPWNASNV